jgi:hypothetical protein
MRSAAIQVEMDEVRWRRRDEGVAVASSSPAAKGLTFAISLSLPFLPYSS